MRSDIIKIAGLMLIFSALLFSQERERWKSPDKLYPLIHIDKKGPVGFDTERPLSLPVSLFIFSYRHIISEHDGDNCPFHPSCSEFLLSAAKSEGLIEGGLIFWDRFTRDVNVFGRREKYTVYKNGRYYDPPWHYSSRRTIYNYAAENEK